MPRDYQRKRDNPYRLPEHLYKRIKYTVKDYDRMQQEYSDMCYETLALSADGLPRGSGVSDPTGRMGERMSALFKDKEAIEQALVEVPAEYRRGVFNEARYGGGFPCGAGEATYKRWKQRFMYHVGRNLNLI